MSSFIVFCSVFFYYFLSMFCLCFISFILLLFSPFSSSSPQSLLCSAQPNLISTLVSLHHFQTLPIHENFPPYLPVSPRGFNFSSSPPFFFLLFSIQVNLYYIQNFPLSSPLLPTSMFSTPFFPCTASCPSSFPVHFPVSL